MVSLREQFRFWAVSALVFLALLWLFRGILLPFVAGMAVAYFLDPLADRLEAAGLSRTAATSVITAVFFVVLIVAIVLLAPLLAQQVTGFMGRLPGYITDLEAVVLPWLSAYAERLDPAQVADIIDGLKQLAGGMVRWLTDVMEGLLRGGLALLSLASLLFITPVVAFYLLRDWDVMVAKVDGWLPRRNAAAIRLCAAEIDRTLAGFVRGQATVCLLLGLFYGVGLSLVGLEFGFIVGLATGILSFVPYFGMLAGFLVGIGLAVAQFSEWVPIGLVALVFAVGQVLEGNFLTPKLVGGRVGLHPVWVMFALLAGGAVFGLVGVMLAVPAAAAIGVLIRFGLGRYLNSRYYDTPTPPDGTSPPL